MATFVSPGARQIAHNVRSSGGELSLDEWDLGNALGYGRDSRLLGGRLRNKIVDELRAAGVVAEFDDRVGGQVRLRIDMPGAPPTGLGRSLTWRGESRPQQAAPETPGPRPVPQVAPTSVSVPTPAPPQSPPVRGDSPPVEPPTLSDTSSAPEDKTGAAGDWLFFGVTVLAIFVVPAIGRELFPGGETGDKNLFFWTVYLKTLPLSGILTAIFLMWHRKWPKNNMIPSGWNPDHFRAALTVGGVLLSGFIGFGFGTNQTENAWLLSHLHYSAIVDIMIVVSYVFASYAFIYGPVLFITSIGSAAWAAWWLHQKLPKHL